MKINLHSHTYYSDGSDNPSVMALEAQKIGLSAHVITDHYSPANPKGSSHSLSKTSFEQQRQECNNFARYTNYNIIQGIELQLRHEEILLFGVGVIREVMNYCLDNFQAYMTRSDYIEIIKLIASRKNQCACILCHPNLNPAEHLKEFYDNLFPILDGYERFNHGHDWFEKREVPKELQPLKAFDNSDAHEWQGLSLGDGNEHVRPIRNEAELIKFIKGTRK